MGTEREKVKSWYDGFTFGKHTDIYNPWSIINFLDKGEYGAYWANSSSNKLVSSLVREGDSEIKMNMEVLLAGETIVCGIDEQIVYNQLEDSEEAIWSLLLASGYLKVYRVEKSSEFGYGRVPEYEVGLTNGEVRGMFYHMVRSWFQSVKRHYNGFVKAMMCRNLKEMNIYMNRVSRDTFSYFDTGKQPSQLEPERFYHGFVLGLIADLSEEYVITSNRESGFGRYDVMIEPKDARKKAFILEFKVHEPDEECSLEETVQAARKQIEEKQYEATLISRGFAPEQIYKYGFAFEGKTVLIG